MDPGTDPDLDPALARLAALGGFFALRTGLPPLPTLEEAYATRSVTDAPDPLAFRVDKVVRLLRAPEVRIGVSVAQQGLAARLWSVTLGAAVLYGQVPDLDPRLLRWDADGSAPDDLWLAEVRSLPGDATTIRQVVQHGHLEALSAALRARHLVSAGLLWGNAGSALAGAARELDRWGRASGREDVGERARELAAELLDHPDLRGTGTLEGTAFRRRSCCLYYRVPGGGVCGDCCFTRPPSRS
ncbi:(2Fe-2S)-binding protein [Streptomyces sporangiiformans]|uniref:(2Fe-2S)-binding protein n=1 Tax=Streptomyces sporangiiformans TaxID=2315329 RepID=A0A505D163_9ACTN|nr:(2Fe-2S)-binding protein [Streptomyces sporangiiformans]TPQ18123.1 (2Fe-2S)-binding protein [Streptomyces sporangiiformans]